MTSWKISKFSILIGWTLPITGMWRGEVFAISDCLVVVVLFQPWYTMRYLRYSYQNIAIRNGTAFSQKVIDNLSRYAFCMVFHVRWIFLTTSLRIPPESRSDEGFGDEWWEIHLTWKTIQNAFSRIFYTLRHLNQVKFTWQNCRSWKPCEMDLSHNCSLYGGRSEVCNKLSIKLKQLHNTFVQIYCPDNEIPIWCQQNYLVIHITCPWYNYFQNPPIYVRVYNCNGTWTLGPCPTFKSVSINKTFLLLV